MNQNSVTHSALPVHTTLRTALTNDLSKKSPPRRRRLIMPPQVYSIIIIIIMIIKKRFSKTPFPRKKNSSKGFAISSQNVRPGPRP